MRKISQCTSKNTLLIVLSFALLISTAMSKHAQAQDKSREVDVIYS